MLPCILRSKSCDILYTLKAIFIKQTSPFWKSLHQKDAQRPFETDYPLAAPVGSVPIQPTGLLNQSSLTLH